MSNLNPQKAMKRTYVQDPVTHELVPKEDWHGPSVSKTAYVMPDIQGYKSMATGEWINSRSEHREHLKRHNLVEIGNEKIENKPRPLDRAGVRRAAEEAVRRVLG